MGLLKTVIIAGCPTELVLSFHGGIRRKKVPLCWKAGGRLSPEGYVRKEAGLWMKKALYSTWTFEYKDDVLYHVFEKKFRCERTRRC